VIAPSRRRDVSGAGFKVGLRVADVTAAATFYRGLGFAEAGSIAAPDGRPVLVVLERKGVHLLVDALVGMPFPDSERERRIQAGPRGLGVAIGLEVDDLEATLRYCRVAGCTITAGPADAPWGDRVFECLDPDGYLWEVSQPGAAPAPGDALAATRASWFGGTAPREEAAGRPSSGAAPRGAPATGAHRRNRRYPTSSRRSKRATSSGRSGSVSASPAK
jgi:catechol 2,3-dioxygenase-like lactoylglutathione lyase family enzyme